MRRKLRLGSAIVIAVITAATACAQSEHCAPGSYNIRDFALPDPGFYAGVYSYGYSTDTLRRTRAATRSRPSPLPALAAV